MELALTTVNLSKKFSGKLVLDNVNMRINKGDVYGFIGKNGAGKTTFIKLIAGLLNPTSGNIEIFESSSLNAERKKIGCVIENPSLYPHFTAKQNLKVQCKLLGIKNFSNAIEEVLETVGLSNVGNKKVKNFSLGMKQKLSIAMALIGDPDLLLLDEPINGLDPAGIKDIRDLIIKLNKEHNKTILISSHLLGELSKVATRYGIISSGKLVKEFSIDDLTKISESYILIKVNDNQKACEILKSTFNTENFEILKDETIKLYECLDDISTITSEFVKSGLLVDSIVKNEQDVEEYFIDLMEGKIDG